MKLAYVLEGDEVFRDVIKRHLEDHNFQVSVCSEFQEISGLDDSIQQQQILVIINLHLIGKKIKEKLNNLCFKKGMKAIIIVDDPQYEFGAINNGAARILSKPVNIGRDLTPTIQELFIL